MTSSNQKKAEYVFVEHSTFFAQSVNGVHPKSMETFRFDHCFALARASRPTASPALDSETVGTSSVAKLVIWPEL